MPMTRAQREKALRLTKSLKAQGNSRNAIVNAVAESVGIGQRSAFNFISHTGLFERQYDKTYSYGVMLSDAADKAWSSLSPNIDTSTHPYYIAARILDAKPGISAEIRDGVCYRNGHPWPAMKFLSEAGVE